MVVVFGVGVGVEARVPDVEAEVNVGGRLRRRRRMATEVGVRVQKDGKLRDADLYRFVWEQPPEGPDSGSARPGNLACRHKSPSPPLLAMI